jgi:DNA-binding response OmpR family regulator
MPTMSTLERENARLRMEVSRLKLMVYDLKQLIMSDYTFPTDWGLTPLEARCINVLMTKALATTEAIINGCYHDRVAGAPLTADNAVRVMMNRLRNKVGPRGVEIQTVRGHGYRLTDSSKELIRQACG